MNHTIVIKTGNPIVDEIGTLNISGNVIPEAWYHTITNENGKVNCLAIHILADIVYWYRPTEHRDESTLSVTYTKKFHDDDYLQRSYDQLMQKFNISKKQAYDAVVALEKLGVIKRHFKTIYTSNLPLANVMFIELIPKVLKSLTFPGIYEGTYKNVDTPLQNCKELSTKTEIPTCENIGTYTNTTTENTTNISTSTTEPTVPASVVDEAKNLLSDLGLSEKEMLSILKASGNDISKCKTAKNILCQQTQKIQNVAGWLIRAVTENYQSVSKKPAAKKNSFHDYQQRDYNFEELEKMLLAN